MGRFEQIFEDFLMRDQPEEILATKIEQEIWDLVSNLKDEYWFHEDVIYSEWDVIKWMKENTPEFYKIALEQPDAVEGSDNLTAALEALGLMKEGT